MVLENFFIHYKKPSQYLYWGESGVDIYNLSGNDNSFRKSKSITNLTLFDISSQQFREIAKEMVALDTGILLNSSQFIFNIFEFEKIPWQASMRKEVVEWRLKKIFPENIDDYVHDFFNLTKKRVISILFKKEIREKLETLFKENNIPLIYMGNSTLEIINQSTKMKKEVPDFFVEIDKSLAIMVFMNKGIPYYIRKFRFDKEIGLINEIIKTVNYIKNNYSLTPHLYFTAADPSEIDLNLIKNELSSSELQAIETMPKDQLFFSR